MPPSLTDHVTGFAGSRLIARGDFAAVASAARTSGDHSPVILDDSTGRIIEIDLSGSADEILAGLAPASAAPKPLRGRPKLGVTAREVTLLPRHWDWLATQPGGASAALRRLVDQARRDSGDADAVRQAQEVTYRVMTTLAGDRPGYEEATRALFARDQARFGGLVGAWPKDICAYVTELSARVWPASP